MHGFLPGVCKAKLMIVNLQVNEDSVGLQKNGVMLRLASFAAHLFIYLEQQKNIKILTNKNRYKKN